MQDMNVVRNVLARKRFQNYNLIGHSKMVTALDERTEPVVLVQIMIGAVVKDGGRESCTIIATGALAGTGGNSGSHDS